MESKIHKSYNNWHDGVTAARAYLQNTRKKHTMLFEQNRNLGDTLHLTPIIRHYRNLHPDSAIAFVVGAPYANAHEFNPHIDRLFLIPNLDPHDRVMLRKKLLTYTELDEMIAPSIFPYGSHWKELNWSYKNIADQYFHNAGVADLNLGKDTPNFDLKGGRKLVLQIANEDREWAKKFMRAQSLQSKTACILEYNSYSAQPKWRYPQFVAFSEHMKKRGIRCISMASNRERPIKGSINACGISWRRTTALMNEVQSFIGIGSGLTMLAAAAENPPTIFELGIPDSISMKGCQYADSISLTNVDPKAVADKISKFVR